MKDIIKLIKEYKTTKYKKEHFLILLERSEEIQFPVYSLIQLINSINKGPSKKISLEGWIEKDVDLKLNKLQKEREYIEKEKTDLKKARLEFEKTLKEERAEAEQIIGDQGNENSNTISVNAKEQITINNQFNHEAIQDAIIIFYLGILSLLTSFIPLIGLLISIRTLIQYKKWINTYKKNIVLNNILKNKLNAGRIFAYISLVIVIIKIINTNIESFKNL